ncbi:hypothetical protein BBP40_006770 [Aspergillus hancockii]|nr:hypothetical protein BBP40_006770 [Aspergillus hancockii]
MKEEPPSPNNQEQDQGLTMPEFTAVNSPTTAEKQTKATPTKRRRKSTTNGDASPSPTKKPKASPAAGQSRGKSLGAIPTSFESAGLADKMILRMRDEEGRNWGDITKAWSLLTGNTVGNSTLRMRYTTMKANFVEIGEADEERLIRLKKEVEDKFEQEKWHRIVEAIEADGGQKYPVPALQKKFKELAKKNGLHDLIKDEE